MSTASKFPTTLVEAVRYFSDEAVCRDFLARLRWPDGVCCLRCDSDRIGTVNRTETATRPAAAYYRCKACRYEFSVKKGTLFEDSAIPLSKWLPAMWLHSAGKKGRSSHQLARDLGITQKSAWFIGHRIRLAMEDQDAEPLSGEVEADETMMGGKYKNKNAAQRANLRPLGRGPLLGKTAFVGVLERRGEGSSKVGAKTVPTRLWASCRPKCGDRWHRDRTSTPTRSAPTPSSVPITSTRSWTTLRGVPQGPGSHQRHRELLVPVQAGHLLPAPQL